MEEEVLKKILDELEEINERLERIERNQSLPKIEIDKSDFDFENEEDDYSQEDRRFGQIDK